MDKTSSTGAVMIIFFLVIYTLFDRWAHLYYLPSWSYDANSDVTLACMYPDCWILVLVCNGVEMRNSACMFFCIGDMYKSNQIEYKRLQRQRRTPSSKKQKYYGCFRAVYCFPNKYSVPFSLMEKNLRGRIALRNVVDVIQSLNHKR